jgi:predicted dienelactone hydrolase
MNRQRILQLAVVVMLILSFSVGCGAPAAQPTPPPTAVPTAQPTPPPTVAPTAQPTPSPQATTPAEPLPAAPAYAIRGPYAVGARDIVIKDGDHTVNITVWYPTLNADHAPEEITYRIHDKLPVKGRAIQNAAPDAAHGPYPFVIFSTGLGGFRQSSVYLLEHLASYGFVVMASDPREETEDNYWAGAATRPIDTKLTIGFADKATAPGGALSKLIDMKHIAVVGHSSGGWTALAGGGAQFDFGWCAAHPDMVTKGSDCAQFVPHAQEIAALLGLKSVPSGLWPPMNDRRVGAIIALAPDGDIWGADYEGVAVVKVPTLIMNGTKDTDNPPELTAYPIYQHLGSAQKGLIKFENATHSVFVVQCRDAMWLPGKVCSQEAWEMDRAHDLINHFATAFLLTELKGDKEAAKALVPGNVSFPGIEYETSGFSAAK